MKKINFSKFKKALFLGIPLMVIVLALSIFQGSIFNVSAQIIPIAVSIEHIDFETVFPGENLQKSFFVSYVDEGDGVNYTIIQQRKPLPENHPEYPNGGDSEMPGYYKNLCPYLTKISNEGEGDNENQAFVGPDDSSDTWMVYFEVPAIFGFVAQDHVGGVIDESGEYGCDISVALIEEEGGDDEEPLAVIYGGGGGTGGVPAFCGDGDLNIYKGEECDDGNNIDGDGCSADCKIEGQVAGETTGPSETGEPKEEPKGGVGSPVIKPIAQVAGESTEKEGPEEEIKLITPTEEEKIKSAFAFSGGCFPCLPWWMVLVLAFYSLVESVIQKRKKGKGATSWFIWFLILIVLSVIFYLTSYTCINIWIFLALSLITILIFASSSDRKRKAIIFVLGLIVLIAFIVLWFIKECVSVWWLFALLVIYFLIAVFFGREKEIEN